MTAPAAPRRELFAVAAWAAAGTLIAFGCSSTGDDGLAVVPYRNVGSETVDASKAPPENNTCDVNACPTVQGLQSCCMTNGNCGVQYGAGGRCSRLPGDAGTRAPAPPGG